MQQIGPGDGGCHDEQLGPKMKPGAVQRVNRGDHGFASLDEQFIPLEGKPRCLVDVIDMEGLHLLAGAETYLLETRGMPLRIIGNA